MGGREEFGTQTYVFSAEWWPKHKGIILGFGFWTEGQWGGCTVKYSHCTMENVIPNPLHAIYIEVKHFQKLLFLDVIFVWVPL
jgi:hypothetical protein